MLVPIYFTSYVLNMFRTLIYPSSGACDYSVELPHWSYFSTKTTNVVIQQNSRKLLTMDILISETCWAHKKRNKIASDIKLVFYSSTITMMHGPINIINFQFTKPFKRRAKSHLTIAGVIRSSPYFPRWQDKG